MRKPHKMLLGYSTTSVTTTGWVTTTPARLVPVPVTVNV